MSFGFGEPNKKYSTGRHGKGKCVICGWSFTKRVSQQITCGDFDCKMELRRQRHEKNKVVDKS